MMRGREGCEWEDGCDDVGWAFLDGAFKTVRGEEKGFGASVRVDGANWRKWGFEERFVWYVARKDAGEMLL